MKIYPVEKLNNEISTDPRGLVAAGELEYHNSISELAKHISENREEKPIILLAGPSGSAKTTTSLRIKALLEELGCSAHVISMDNYFLPIKKEHLNKLDLESPDRLDLQLLSQHFEKIWECQPVELPLFDFTSQDRQQGGILHRSPGEIIIYEGIHALNPQIMGAISNHACGVYVSVRTRLGSGEELLHPEKIRLMRRLMRDHQFRGREIPDILESYFSVQEGEHKYIMPYKQYAAYDIDTFTPYEVAVYRDRLLPELMKLDDRGRIGELISDMKRFLAMILPLPSEYVPESSIVREFLGN